MHRYDTVLKELLTNRQNLLFERITGARIDHWLNVEFPGVRQTRADLLGETADRQRIIGLELQSTSDSRLPLCMAEYALRTYRIYDRFRSSMSFMWGTLDANPGRTLRAKLQLSLQLSLQVD